LLAIGHQDGTVSLYDIAKGEVAKQGSVAESSIMSI
jgi:hypothetical protein